MNDRAEHEITRASLAILASQSLLLKTDLPNRGPNAWIGHVPFAIWIIEQLKPRIFVELGTHYGHSYFSFCQSVQANGLTTKCYAVDTWQGDEHAGRYGEDVFGYVDGLNQRQYYSFSRLLRMYFDDALAYFSDGTVDLLHIDGLHTYEAVRHDFEAWLPKLSSRGVVLFHDINVRERGFGVWRLWEELSDSYPHIEFEHSHGLGVLFVGKVQPPSIMALIEDWSATECQYVVKNWFAKLGYMVGLEYQTSNLNQGIAERDARIASLTTELTEREAQQAILSQGIAERDARIAEILSSRSWQITWPLRLLSERNKPRRAYARQAGTAAEVLPSSSPLPLERPIGDRLRLGIYKAKREYYRLVGNKKKFLKYKQKLLLNRMQSATMDCRQVHMGLRQVPPESMLAQGATTDQGRATMRQVAGGFAHKPLISVVMPCYNPKPEWLKEAIESVRRQLYPHWELCIADDASTDPAIRPILEDYSRRDARIKVVFRTLNGYISAASNSALALATGEYVALLDHDDLLAEHALFWVAEAINRQPNAGLIYSDEDKVSESGQRSNPYFKCDWNYDLFLSHNMICHLGVYKAGLLRDIGGFREGFEGSQDYDLALRCIEQLDASQIIHIPRVLYHWRMHKNSTAQISDAKPYAYVAAERALNEHLARKGVSAQVERHPEINGCYRVRYALPEPAPLVTLIIPTRNGLHLIRQCLSSILEKTDYPHYEILVVDNGSDDPQTLAYFDSVVSDPRLRILRDDRPFNFSTLNNRAVQAARGELVGLINNDIEVINPQWLTEMVSIALQPRVGCVGARLWYPNNTLQHGGVVLGLGGVAGHSHKHLPKKHPGYFGRAVLQQSFSAVTAACLVIRRSIFLEVGGMEESLKIAFGDVDFCLRVREAGYRNVWTPFAELYHHESATRGFEDTPEKKARFAGETQYLQDRWGRLLLSDPAYSPNLTLDREDFSYSCPPRVAPLDPSHYTKLIAHEPLART